MKLDPFYPIVDSAAWIERLAPLGVKFVQLRIKEADDATLRREIGAALAVCRRHDCRLVVNDYWQLAIELGCEWLHLGQEDLAAADVAAIRRVGLKLGLSTHDEAELETALAHRPDYVALGPVYPTRLKQMKWGPQGLDRVRDWKRRVGDVPLVAIGGLTPDRAPAVLEQGADLVSVVTDILLHPDPEVRVGEWIAVTAPWR